MSETTQTPPPVNSFEEGKIQIKTLFAQLTKIVTERIRTRKDGADALVMVSNWAAIILATIIVILEGKSSPAKAMENIDRVSVVMNQEMKKHFMVIRGLSNIEQAKEKRIIVPGEGP